MAESENIDEEPASIPGLAGAAVAVANSKPFTSLFGPSAKALGEYWGEITEAKVEGWRRKRVENTAAHVERVMALDGEHSAPYTEERARLQDEWRESAEKIDPEHEPEIAALWEGLLSSIMRGDAYAGDMLAALQALRASDAWLLMRLSQLSTPTYSQEAAYTRLYSAGLIGKFKVSTYPYNIFFSVAIFAAFTGVIAASVQKVFEIDIFKYTGKHVGILAIAAFLLVGMGMFSTMIYSLTKYRLTRLGQRLKNNGQRYMDEFGPKLTEPFR
jgi:hypothetical protein